MRLVLVATFWMFASVGHGFAQVEQVREPPAEVWLARVLKEQRQSAIVGRYVAAPLSVALGGAAAIVPVAVDTSVASSLAFVGSSALMLTSAIAYWAHEDPDEARRQMAIWGSLGYTSFGAGLMLSCVTKDDFCPETGLGRRLQIGVGVFEAGLFASNALFMLLMPPPSASALELSVRGLGGSERRARVLDFLEQRDRQRRVASYVGAPWGLGLGTYLMTQAAVADDPHGKAWLYSMGASLLAFNLVFFMYEQLRTGDADRLRANEYP